MVFGNGVKNIQAAAYNGARTVYVHLRQQILKPVSIFFLKTATINILTVRTINDVGSLQEAPMGAPFCYYKENDRGFLQLPTSRPHDDCNFIDGPHCISVMPEPCPPPQYFANQLTLFETGRAECPPLLLLAPPMFFTFRHHCTHIVHSSLLIM